MVFIPGIEYALYAFIVFIVVLCFLYPDRWVGTRARPDLTGPKGWPLVGNTPRLLLDRDDPLNNMLKGQEEFGYTLSITLPLGRMISINRPEWIEHVQKTNFENYPKGKYFRSLFSDILGVHGIFVSDGDTWKTQRKSASHIFTVGAFRSHITTVLHEELAVLKELLGNLADRGEAFDFQDIAFRFTLASFGRMAFSQDFDCLPRDPKDLDKPVEFARAFDYAQNVLDDRITNPIWKFTELFSNQGKKMRKAVATVQGYAYGVIDRRLQESEKSQKDLLGLFMDLTTDRTALMETVLNFLIAGRDTTAQATSWGLYEICANPDEFQRLRNEVDQVLGTRLPNYDDLKDVPYHVAAFNETLRLHPSVPKNFKQAVKDDVLPAIPGVANAKVVHAGDLVSWSDYTMARDPLLWGKDCREYKPQRWIDGSSVKKESPYLAHFFNAGPRLCLGQTLATFEGVSLISSIVRDFDVTLMNPNEPHYGNSLTLPMKEPFMVKITRRKMQ